MKKYSWIIILLVLILTPRIWADDTDIYGTSTISVEPNVLIIFDTSGSMSTEDVISEYYDPNETYTLDSGSYTNNAVYRKKWDGSYTMFANDINDINCSSVKTALETKGYTRKKIKNASGGFWCNGSKKTLALGNWINYDKSTGGARSRNEVAREVITNLIDITEDVRFGLMRFNKNDGDDQGGYIVAPVGTDKATLKNIVNDFPTSGYTPLAETLAEAGLYYAGKKSWFNGSVDGKYSSDCDNNGNNCYQYSSPIDLRCRKNYIILMTDGASTQDKSSKLTSSNYINGDKIGDYDNDGKDPGSYSLDGSDYLDDVAKYLYENDLSPLGSVGESFEKQNVVVYTIGFRTDQQLLSDTAQNGGGEYYTANSISGLSAAFEEIMADIADVNAVFVSPVVPVSRMNRTFAGSSLYVGFFKPQIDGRWAGNIKKYGLDSHGNIVDATGSIATLDNGSIKTNARSYWSDVADGPNVLLGGLGDELLDQATRNLYTLIDPMSNLTHPNNTFSISNALITADILGDGVTTPAERDNVINDIHGASRSWILGDILHSRPSVVHYDLDNNGTLDDAMIFAGSNDGMMHCFKDSDGSEVWGFIPPDQLDQLYRLSDGSTDHKYFVDGVPVVYEEKESPYRKILLFGERRGGSSYYALNVTQYDMPGLVYSIGPTFLADKDGDGDGTLDGVQGVGGNATLGQSWSAPAVHKIKTSSGSDSEMVFLMAGGYDENQDKPLPVDPLDIQSDERDPEDKIGRAVFTINAITGAISKLNVNAGYYTAMTHSIVDVSGFDSNGNGYTNRIYAGDLGGNIFAFEDDGTIEHGGDGTWSRRWFFSASAVDSVQRKIFYSPDAVEETYGEMIFFGTGDRANPEGKEVVNRIYAVKNTWEDPSSPTFYTLNESDLYDATEDLIVLGSLSDQAEAHTKLNEKKGWYIELDQNTGEKVTSAMTVFDGVVYFTTYTPEPDGGSGSPDSCEIVSGRGQARLYALNYKTGEAAFEWSDIEERDNTDEHNIVPKGRWDRSKIIGTSIASAPVVAILKGGPQIYIGVEGGVKKEDPNVKQALETFFWRQMDN